MRARTPMTPETLLGDMVTAFGIAWVARRLAAAAVMREATCADPAIADKWNRVQSHLVDAAITTEQIANQESCT